MVEEVIAANLQMKCGAITLHSLILFFCLLFIISVLIQFFDFDFLFSVSFSIFKEILRTTHFQVCFLILPLH